MKRKVLMLAILLLVLPILSCGEQTKTEKTDAVKNLETQDEQKLNDTMRYVIVRMWNKTDITWKVIDDETNCTKGDFHMVKPDLIHPNKDDQWIFDASGDVPSPDGTQGYVTYKNLDDKSKNPLKIKISWKVGDPGDYNKFRVEVSDNKRYILTCDNCTDPSMDRCSECNLNLTLKTR